MARLMDDNWSNMPPSSMASQTILSESLSQGPEVKGKKPRPLLPKIKSSPGTALHPVSSHQPSANNSSHRRGNSASATSQSPTFVPNYLLQNTGLPNASKSDVSQGISRYDGQRSSDVARSKTSGKVNKIKPLILRKWSSQDKMATVDLSRSVTEHEDLGMYTSIEKAAAVHTPSGPIHQGYHQRNLSGNSQISTATSNSNRLGGATYVHPMRQTPRAYTPPISGKTSLDEDHRRPTPPFSATSHTSNSPNPPPSLSARRLNTVGDSSAPLPPLQLRSTSSKTNMHQIYSAQPGTPSSLRFAAGTGDPLSTSLQSPSTGILSAGLGNTNTARSSLESQSHPRFLGKRSRSNTAQTATSKTSAGAVDPESQAASVAVLRQKFQEREAAKEAKYKAAELKAEEKERRKRERKASSAAASLTLSAGSNGVDPRINNRYGSSSLGTTPASYGPATSNATEKRKVKGHWAMFWYSVKSVWLSIKRSFRGGKKVRGTGEKSG